MSTLRVFHNHELIGEHDPRCEPLPQGVAPADRPYHRRHEGNDLIASEAGQETRYPAGTWSGADTSPNFTCAYMADYGARDCPRCADRGLGAVQAPAAGGPLPQEAPRRPG